MRVVVALGGNALLRRGEPADVAHEQPNVVEACGHLARVAAEHELVVSHGNGPQVGVLALEEAALGGTGAVPGGPEPSPMDVLVAGTQGMVGYLLERALTDLLPADRPVATLLTMVEVDPDDPALDRPDKPIGPRYGAAEAADLEARHGWSLARDGDGVRRVVPSPSPTRIVEERQVRTLLDAGYVVVCAGGGGIPVSRTDDGHLQGVEAVVDKDRTAALLARDLDADVLVLATDVPAVELGFGTSSAVPVAGAHPDALLGAHRGEFAPGSMLPKVEAACDFVRSTGRPAAIGRLEDIERLVDGGAGTRIAVGVRGVVMRRRPAGAPTGGDRSPLC